MKIAGFTVCAKKKGKFQILGSVDLGTIFSTCTTRLMGFGWFNLVRDRDSKVRGPRARPGLVTLYQGRFVRTKVGPCVPGSARSLPACRSVFSFKQYIEIPVEISDVFFMATLVVRVTKICFWLRRYFWFWNRTSRSVFKTILVIVTVGENSNWDPFLILKILFGTRAPSLTRRCWRKKNRYWIDPFLLPNTFYSTQTVWHVDFWSFRV